MKIDYPESIKTTDLDKFCAVFNQLIHDRVSSIEYNRLGMVIKINFKDGSSCGSAVPWIKAGMIDKNELRW